MCGKPGLIVERKRIVHAVNPVFSPWKTVGDPCIIFLLGVELALSSGVCGQGFLFIYRRLVRTSGDHLLVTCLLSSCCEDLITGNMDIPSFLCRSLFSEFSVK